MYKRHYIIILTITLSLVTIAIPQSFAQDTIQESPIQVSRIGLDVSLISLEVGDIQGAIYATDFASRHFALHMGQLAGNNPEQIADIHIMLLDIPHIIKSQDITQSTKAINDVTTTLNDLSATDIQPRKIVSEILTVADEQYLVYDKEENVIAYEISTKLFEKARQIFEIDYNPDSMKDVEQISFFNDIDEAVKNRDNFVKVGNLVSAIQRDLAGTKTVIHDQSKLYENIRVLYAQMMVVLEQGDYTTAEELAIEAYLENFEYLEHDLEIVDAQFMYILEIDMRQDLRSMIKNTEDVETIREFVDGTIIPDLNRGEAMTISYLSENQGFVPEIIKEKAERGSSTNEQREIVMNEIDFIRETLHEMLVHYENGDYDTAYASARTAYLDSYEFIEIPLRPIDPDFTLEVEYQFAEMRNLIKERAAYTDIQKIVIEIERNLDESERLVTGTGQIAPLIAFTASFAIIFREGLESVLILGAIMTYLEASRNTRFKPYVHYGIIAAIAATAITWIIASYVIEISGASRELIEAIAALSATAVLFYVSFWILNKIEHKKWMEFVKAKVWQATTTGSVMVFVMLSFFTVYREGFETVLFYQAMLGFAKYMELYVGAGFVLGIGALLLIYFVMRKLGKRLPLRVLFGLTMGIGAYLSIAFLGNAIRELQVLDIVPYTAMFGVIPRLDINMATMTGIYPTLETTIAQIVLLVVYIVASGYVLIMRPRRERKIAQMRKSRANGDTDHKEI